MKITNKKQKPKIYTFHDIKKGETFQVEGSLAIFMKIDTHRSVSLGSGDSILLETDRAVIPCECELIVYS